MPGSAGARSFGLLLVAASVLLAACNVISPATPTPTPATSAAATGRGAGPGGGARGQGANGQGQGANGQGAGQGQGRGQGQGPRQAQGNGSGQGQGDGRPTGGFRGSGGPGASGTPDPNSPIVNGEVDIVDGRTVTVATNTGWRKVEVPDAATILTEGRGTPADLAIGALVGVTGKPDGTAVSIRMFPPGSSPRTGQFPMNGPQAGNVMTNARIEAFDGSKLALDMNGEKASITVPPETEVLKSVPAALSDIVLGARVQAIGTMSGDTLTAQRVMILGAQRGGRT